jgi:hypothetical protein
MNTNSKNNKNNIFVYIKHYLHEYRNKKIEEKIKREFFIIKIT